MVRIPERPPELAWESIATSANIPGVVDVVREANDRYLHWDDVKRRPLPKGLSQTQAWTHIKFSRLVQKTSLSLNFEDSHSTLWYWTPPQQQEWLHKIDQQAGGALAVPSSLGLPDDNERYLINSLMEEAIASSQLEGASTTREIAKRILRGSRRPRDRSDLMIVNNYRAIREIRDRKDEPLSSELITSIQEIITEGTLDNPSHAGRFRTADDDICVADCSTGDVLFTPPHADKINERIQQMCEFVNQENRPFIHPVIRAVALHFCIGYIHPFGDGNGRTARALFYWNMLKNGYWLFEFLPISRIFLKGPTKYARAYLCTETDDGDLTYFVHYNLDVIIRAIDELHEYLSRQQTQLKEITGVLSDDADLNFRQIELIRNAIKHPSKPVLIQQHRGKYNVAYATARSDLLGLEERGLFRRQMAGNRITFYPADDLVRQLKAAKKSAANRSAF